MTNKLFLLTALVFSALSSIAQKNKNSGEFYQIKVYHFTEARQDSALDQYLKNAYLPALHIAGIKQVGVFKHIANDTASVKKVYVFFAVPGLETLSLLPTLLVMDSAYQKASYEYMTASYQQPPYARLETILLSAFRLAPQMILPALKSKKTDRIYELRSYESATEKLGETKIRMFNEGGEVALFKRLNFNAVFYGEVIIGSKMPNLMYMTTFENQADRDTHWETFRTDPEWKRLSSLAEYQNTVSKAEIILMKPTEYSDF